MRQNVTRKIMEKMAQKYGKGGRIGQWARPAQSCSTRETERVRELGHGFTWETRLKA